MLLDNIGRLIKDVLDASVALAAHFHGNGGLKMDLKTPEEHGGNGKAVIKKYEKVLYSAEGDCPHCLAKGIVIAIIDAERIRSAGPRHKNCPICKYIFETVEEKLKMFEVAARFAGQIEEALGHIEGSQAEKTEVPSDQLN